MRWASTTKHSPTNDNRLNNSILPDYTVWVDGSTIYAEANYDGTDYSGTTASTVLQNAIDGLTEGHIHIKDNLSIGTTLSIGASKYIKLSGEMKGNLGTTLTCTQPLISEVGSQDRVAQLEDLYIVGSGTPTYGVRLENFYRHSYLKNVTIVSCDYGFYGKQIYPLYLENVEFRDNNINFLLNDVALQWFGGSSLSNESTSSYNGYMYNTRGVIAGINFGNNEMPLFVTTTCNNLGFNGCLFEDPETADATSADDRFCVVVSISGSGEGVGFNNCDFSGGGSTGGLHIVRGIGVAVRDSRFYDIPSGFTALKIYDDAGVDNIMVDNAHFVSVAGTKISLGASATNIKIEHTPDFLTENCGSDSIASGNTSKTITHGLGTTPSAEHIHIIGKEDPTNSVGTVWIDTITSTQFNVNVENDPGASNWDFGWFARIPRINPA